MNKAFAKLANAVAVMTGKPWSFALCLALVLIWALSGPLFHYSDTWQLVINTGTTIITFLMVFLIQNTQNRENEALHAKLDELIRAVADAQDSYIGLDRRSDEEIERLREQVADETGEPLPNAGHGGTIGLLGGG